MIRCNVVIISHSGASEPDRSLGRAEALGGVPVLSSGQSEVQSYPGASLFGLLPESGRDAPQVCSTFTFTHFSLEIKPTHFRSPTCPRARRKQAQEGNSGSSRSCLEIGTGAAITCNSDMPCRVRADEC